VIARTSAFQFKGVSLDIREVGRRLDADFAIEGSVRKAGDQVRITVQTIQTESGYHLWSETFQRELKDIFAIQEENAEWVVGSLRLHMPEPQRRFRSRVASAGWASITAPSAIYPSQKAPGAARR
jgi:adenylate cyclase